MAETEAHLLQKLEAIVRNRERQLADMQASQERMYNDLKAQNERLLEEMKIQTVKRLEEMREFFKNMVHQQGVEENTTINVKWEASVSCNSEKPKPDSSAKECSVVCKNQSAEDPLPVEVVTKLIEQAPGEPTYRQKEQEDAVIEAKACMCDASCLKDPVPSPRTATSQKSKLVFPSIIDLFQFEATRKQGALWVEGVFMISKNSWILIPSATVHNAKKFLTTDRSWVFFDWRSNRINGFQVIPGRLDFSVESLSLGRYRGTRFKRTGHSDPPNSSEEDLGVIRGGVGWGGVKALHIIQSEGPSFRLKGHFVKWKKWKFKVGFIPSEELVVYSEAYLDDRRGRRSATYQRNLTKVALPCRDSDEPNYQKKASDSGQNGLGKNAPATRRYWVYFDPEANGSSRFRVRVGDLHLHVENSSLGRYRGTRFKMGHVQEEKVGLVIQISNLNNIRHSWAIILRFLQPNSSVEVGRKWFIVFDNGKEKEVEFCIEACRECYGQPILEVATGRSLNCRRLKFQNGFLFRLTYISIVEESWTRVENEKVYASVGRDVEQSTSTLLWALDNFSRVHYVQQLDRFNITACQPRDEELRARCVLKRENKYKIWAAYILICNKAGVQAENRFLEMKVIDKVMVDLIEQIVVLKLVMGAAVDIQYSERLTELKSTRATIRATDNFETPINIGEDGYWRISRGYIHHTQVVMKVLQSVGPRVPSQFHKKLDVMTKLRHSNIATLIGVCYEARALVYEHIHKVLLSAPIPPQFLWLFSCKSKMKRAFS